MRAGSAFWRWSLAAAAVLVVAAGLALARWWPSEQALAERVADAAGQRLGVAVTVGALQWQLLPRPQVVLQDLATVQARPLRLQTLRLWPRLLPLLQGRLELSRLVLEGAHVDLRALRGLGSGGAAATPGPALAIDRVEFRALTLVSHSGIPVVYEGEADLDAGLVLQRLQLRRPGVEPVAQLEVRRTAQQETELRYALELRVGGGTAAGQAALQTAPDGSLRLQGRLSLRGVEVESALAAFQRRSPVAGRANGETTLQAEGDTLPALLRDLRTETRFTMAPATFLRLDLDRVIQTLGREHQGQTPLESFSGRVLTRNTDEGLALRFLDLQARAGKLSARGQASLHARRLEATAAVDLVDGVVGVPVHVAGRLGALQVTVDKAPLIGAAAGTAVLPGVGTAIGAAIGRMLGGSGPAAPAEGRAPTRAPPAP